jgi:hypothetical protein
VRTTSRRCARAEPAAPAALDRAGRIARLARNERLSGAIGFAWGLAEGIVFFIVPDVYISFATLFSPASGAVAWLASIAGSAVAVSILSVLARIPDLDYRKFLESVPGISAALVERVSKTLSAEGLPFDPLLALGGVPLKVYAGVAFSLEIPLGTVLLWTVFARVARIAPTLLFAAAVRRLFRRSIDARPAAWAALVAIFWLFFYVLDFIVMSRT